MSEENKFDFDSSEEREPQSHQSETHLMTATLYLQISWGHLE